MFLGDLFGLVLAEVSFDNDDELDNFPLPSFALADVTNNELFTWRQVEPVVIRGSSGRIDSERFNQIKIGRI